MSHALLFCLMIQVSLSAAAKAEPLRVASTLIAEVHGPLWLTKEAGLLRKYGIEPEFIYIAGESSQNR